ncbi:MAG: TrkH family potassium uptake protein [Ignavibacteriae bacterium]|nr:TrkH family potassium uptake protein [Ignavibacteriota bacterium]
MRLVPVLGVIGFLLIVVGVAMLTALPFSYMFDGTDFQPILYSALITIAAGVALMLFMKRMPREELGVREGFAIVTFGWVVVALFGSLPFLFTGATTSFTDAYFETISGFTTTGSSIFTDVESLSHGLLYWRALTHWLGGMGIIVLSLAVLPILGIGGMQLFKAEVAGPTKDKLTPRVAETARLLWGLYVLLTAVETGLLMYGGMSFFDAICHAFATISTGGFSTKNASLATYDSAYFDWIVTLFMFIGGTNFALHYSALKGNVGSYFKDNEFMFFLISAIVAVLIVTLSISPGFYEGDVMRAFRYAAFNVVSVMTCTGFANADFAVWAPLAQVVLLFMMFPGASAGSTGGGLKNIRVLLLLKTGVNELKKLVHPKIVSPIRYNGRMVEQDTLFTVGGFLILYLITFSTASIILTATGLDIVTSMSAVAASMANVGPGLGTVGPMANYAHLTDFAKWVLGACMLLGRLEIFTVFALFSSAFWKR